MYVCTRGITSNCSARPSIRPWTPEHRKINSIATVVTTSGTAWIAGLLVARRLDAARLHAVPLYCDTLPDVATVRPDYCESIVSESFGIEICFQMMNRDRMCKLQVVLIAI